MVEPLIYATLELVEAFCVLRKKQKRSNIKTSKAIQK